jgi:hypothetical protein
MTVPCCDFTNEQFPCGVEGGGYIDRGATGRWCVVMYAGPQQVAKHVTAGGVVLSEEEAYAYVASQGNGDYADF